VTFILDVLKNTGQQTIKNTENIQLLKSNNTKYSKTKVPSFSHLYDTRPENEVSTMVLSPHL